MKSYFPQFRYFRTKKGATWKGWSQPTEQAPKYKILVRYKLVKYPSVWVLDPPIAATAPHRYSDGSLCLYFPDDQSWKSNMFLAKTVIPWAAEWLRFYEIWLITGIWYGPEAHHSEAKLKP